MRIFSGKKIMVKCLQRIPTMREEMSFCMFLNTFSSNCPSVPVNAILIKLVIVRFLNWKSQILFERYGYQTTSIHSETLKSPFAITHWFRVITVLLDHFRKSSWTKNWKLISDRGLLKLRLDPSVIGHCVCRRRVKTPWKKHHWKKRVIHPSKP